jgi:hypothetical protein
MSGNKKFVPNEALSKVLDGCKDLPFRASEVIKLSKESALVWNIDAGLRPYYLPLNEQNLVKSK